jgi:hypothetical protein
MSGRFSRMVRAVLVVGLIVAFVPVAGAAGEVFSWVSVVTTGASSLIGASLDDDEEVGVKFEEYFEEAISGVSLQRDIGGIPASFTSECLDLSGRHDITVAGDGTLVGFVEDGRADGVFDAVASQLDLKGWTLLESGSDTQATFMKEEGSHRWLYVSCVQVSDKTSVVIQCA